MFKTTWCGLVEHGKILLGMKKVRLGEGKWNGFGGKLEPGETTEQAAAREMLEESGVTVKERDLKKVAVIEFYYSAKPEWDQVMSVFLASSGQGEPLETEEMIPQWFELSAIPYDTMWPDDKFWLPKVLAGKKVTGKFYFGADGTIVQHQLEEVSEI